MIINSIVYGIYKSIKEKKNMFPEILRLIDAKANVYKRNSVFIDIQDNTKENDN